MGDLITKLDRLGIRTKINGRRDGGANRMSPWVKNGVQ